MSRESIEFEEGKKLVALRYQKDKKPQIIKVTTRTINSQNLPNSLSTSIRTIVDENGKALIPYDMGNSIYLNEYRYFVEDGKYILFTNELDAYEYQYFELRRDEMTIENEIFEIEEKLRNTETKYSRNRKSLNDIIRFIRVLREKSSKKF